MAPRDTRNYQARAWDALTGVSSGFVAGTQHYLAARQAAGSIVIDAPGAGVHVAISQIDVSFFGQPTGTSLVSIHHGAAQGTITFQAFLTAGQNRFSFDPPRLAPANTMVHIVIGPGGGTAVTNIVAGTVVPYPYQV